MLKKDIKRAAIHYSMNTQMHSLFRSIFWIHFLKRTVL